MSQAEPEAIRTGDGGLDELLAGLSEVDVCFVIDTTASMGPFLDAARAHARGVAEQVAATAGLDFRFAVVEYRDHPPQDGSFAARLATPMFTDRVGLQHALDQLLPEGGGDLSEAVLDGLVLAAQLPWRPGSERLLFLVGDAPPHGSMGLVEQEAACGEAAFDPETVPARYDAWPHGCPCRATPGGVVELLRGNRIRLHAIAVGGNGFDWADRAADAAFRELAEGTGGTFQHQAHARSAVHATAGVYSVSASMVSAAREFVTASAELGSAAASDAVVADRLGWSTEMVAGVRSYVTDRTAVHERYGVSPIERLFDAAKHADATRARMAAAADRESLLRADLREELGRRIRESYSVRPEDLGVRAEILLDPGATVSYADLKRSIAENAPPSLLSPGNSSTGGH